MYEPRRRADQRKHHILYKTICLDTCAYYIGIHSTDNLNDGYLGSGQRLRRSVSKYGKTRHSREVLEYFSGRKELSDAEKRIVTEELLLDPLCMNLMVGGEGNFLAHETAVSTRQKRSANTTSRWLRDRSSLKLKLEDDIKNFAMSRDEVLKILLTKEGYLNKNITRHLATPKKEQAFAFKLNRRATTNEAKWKFIRTAIQNPEFGNNAVELINAYVFEIKNRPTCKTCGDKVTFFRFNQPYAVYCGNRCQLLDPKFKNPVLSRWNKARINEKTS